MEIETSQPVVAKKVWNIVRIVLLMLRRGIAKSKVVSELHLLLKRGKLAAAKAIATTLTLRHHYAAAFTCHSGGSASFVSPREYEFSCSNSPAFLPIMKSSRHKHYRNHRHQYDDVSTVTAVQKVLDILNNNSDKVVEAYSSSSPLPGFGKSPIGKQLRVTDSPFPLKDEGDEGDCHVDMAAEEFIKRFYKDLNLQQKMAAFQSPYNNSWDR